MSDVIGSDNCYLLPARYTLPFARSESAARAGSAARKPAGTHSPAPRLGQVAAGALADRIGGKAPITAGTFLIAGGLGVFVATSAHGAWFAAAGLMRVGMSLAYPHLITAVGDTADPAWRGGALGVYRLWREGGYAIGPLVLGAIAVIGGITAAIWAGVALVGTSGVQLLVWLRETDPKRRRQNPAWRDHPEWVAP